MLKNKASMPMEHGGCEQELKWRGKLKNKIVILCKVVEYLRG